MLEIERLSENTETGCSLQRAVFVWQQEVGDRTGCAGHAHGIQPPVHQLQMLQAAVQILV